jgi:hypothetical protein
MVTGTAVASPIVILLVFSKLFPVMVTSEPTGPLLGLKLVMLGCAMDTTLIDSPIQSIHFRIDRNMIINTLEILIRYWLN